MMSERTEPHTEQNRSETKHLSNHLTVINTKEAKFVPNSLSILQIMACFSTQTQLSFADPEVCVLLWMIWWCYETHIKGFSGDAWMKFYKTLFLNSSLFFVCFFFLFISGLRRRACICLEDTILRRYQTTLWLIRTEVLFTFAALICRQQPKYVHE